MVSSRVSSRWKMILDRRFRIENLKWKIAVERLRVNWSCVWIGSVSRLRVFDLGLKFDSFECTIEWHLVGGIQKENYTHLHQEAFPREELISRSLERRWWISIFRGINEWTSAFTVHRKNDLWILSLLFCVYEDNRGRAEICWRSSSQIEFALRRRRCLRWRPRFRHTMSTLSRASSENCLPKITFTVGWIPWTP